MDQRKRDVERAAVAMTRLVVVLTLAACDAGVQPQAAVDPAEHRDESLRAVLIATDVAYTEPPPYFDRGYVVARFDEHAGRGLGRVRRDGGRVERLDGDFVHRGIVYRTDSSISDEPFGFEVTLSRAIDGKRHVMASVADATVGTDYTIVAERMYWTAGWPGVGPLMATDVQTGATATALGCVTRLNAICARIVPGTPALAYKQDAVYRLEPDRVVRIEARCPMDPQTRLRQEPVRAFGDFMLCEMRATDVYDENPSLAVPGPVLVSLVDGSQHAPRGLGRDTTFARGHLYHSVPAGIARRRAVDAPDELVVQIDGRDEFDRMAVDDETLVWTKRSSMWSAPLD